MTLMPAIQQQKVLIFSAIAVVLIVVGGSWAATTGPASNTQTGTSTQNGATDTPKPKKNLTLLLQPKQSGKKTIYTLKIAPTPELLQSVGLRLKVEGIKVVETSQKSGFTNSSELGSTGWQAAVNSVLKTENNNTTMEVGFVNLAPQGAPVTEELVLGEFTVEPLSTSTTPLFTVDQSVSTAFTKDGSSMMINLTVQPASATE